VKTVTTYSRPSHQELLQVGQALVRYNPGSCSGFFVRSDLVATAAHCLRDRSSSYVDVHLRTAQIVRGRIVAKDFDLDIGPIRIMDKHDQLPLELDTRELAVQTEIYAAVLLKDRGMNGHPFNVEYGRLLYNKSPWWDGREWWAADVHSEGGYSGSPFVYQGKAIGVLTAGRDNPRTTYATPSSYLQAMMESL
jgi:hypothetical protein